ncbi:MAG: CHC2 zinc finger domain-containing protein, partial [Gemmatimonadota bacterium]|nr:CHC2 zinc finger domain-containing protein [Gemmatimonadota bacterium]
MSTSAAASRYDPETIKRERPISDVVMSCGIQVHPSGPHTYKALCPFHTDRRPSLLLDERDNHYHCFACRAHGDTIDFVMARLGVSFAEACARLAGPAVSPRDSSAQSLDAVPGAVGARASSEGDGKRRPGERRWDRLDLEEQMVMNTAQAVYKHLLWRTPNALEYLRRRSIPDWVIRECGLGYADGRTLETYLRRRHGLGTAQRLGLLKRPTRGTSSPHLRELLSGRVVVPELRGGQCIWMIGRALSDSPHVPRYLALPGERPVLGLERAAGREEAYLCEGVIDWLTAVAWKLPAFST